MWMARQDEVYVALYVGKDDDLDDEMNDQFTVHDEVYEEG